MPRPFGRPQWKPGAEGSCVESRSMSSEPQVNDRRVSMKFELDAVAIGEGTASWAPGPDTGARVVVGTGSGAAGAGAARSGAGFGTAGGAGVSAAGGGA